MGSEMCIRDRNEERVNTFAKEGDAPSQHPHCCATRGSGGAAPEAQAPLPWLRGAAFETRPPVAEVMPRLRGTALLPRVPVAEIGPWLKGTALEARVPFVEFVPELRGTALAAQVSFDGTAP